MLEIITIILLIIAYCSNIISDNIIIRGSSLFFIYILLVIGWIMFYEISTEPIIIEKSLDSDWKLSNNYNIKRDTCITEIKIINQSDTIYPTTCYKVLKR